MDPNVKDSIVARLKEATNVLVTVSSNPSVDQLAACIGFTLLLNKIGKRGAAVFSGEVPSTLEFLQPDKTIEKNTDSLRDFIIALDKSKADKLRYKVEDRIVKIFITPYRTSISDKDLDFSQGDFNVDVVLALGVHEKSELDQAIVSHGRILHDATVISVNNKDQGSLGTLNWVDLQSSSLSEMMASVGEQLSHDAFDNQIATALMTGIVAETDRFSNEKTTPATMKLASELMGAGANQQLIASKLQESSVSVGDSTDNDDTDNDGELSISHDENNEDTSKENTKPDNNEDEAKDDSSPPPELKLPKLPEEFTDDSQEEDTPKDEDKTGSEEDKTDALPRISPARSLGSTGSSQPKPLSMSLEPPKMGGKLTANSEPEHLTLDPSTDPMSAAGSRADNGILSRRSGSPSLAPLPGSGSDDTKDNSVPISPPTPPMPPMSPPSATPHPLTALPPVEPEVKPPEEDEIDEEKIEDAREAVDEAIKIGGDPEKNLEPIQALGSQPVNLNLGHEPLATDTGASTSDVSPAEPLPSSPEPNSENLNTPTPPPAPISSQPSSLMDTNSFINPSITPPSSGLPSPMATPPGLVPNGVPTDKSGSSGPATPPPPVPPPMMPPVPPSN